MKPAIALIIEERTRQQDSEGWTPQHDDTHTGGELARAAACYALASSAQISGCDSDEIHDLTVPRVGWPWDDESFKLAHPLRNLVKAGALILAEIERLQRQGEKREDSLPVAGFQKCAECHGMGWVPSRTEADTDPCPECAGGFR